MLPATYMSRHWKTAMKKQNKKTDARHDEFEDVTVAEMNVDGMPWYKDKAEKKKEDELESLNISKAEQRAMIKGAYSAMFPAFFIGLLVFCAAFGLIMLLFWFWSR